MNRAAIVMALLGSAGAAFSAAPAAAAKDAPKTPDGWIILYDGRDLDAWDFRPDGWVIDDQKALYSSGKAGDIYSKQKFQDFALDLEFKVAKGSNSGVFLRMEDRKDWLHSGIEIQVFDSAGKKPGKHDCGAVYDVLAPSANPMRKAGEWNRFLITAVRNRLFIALNGVQIIDMDLDQWTEAGMNPDGLKNKFKRAYKTMTQAGFFALQGHGSQVWYRDIRAKPLTALAKCPGCGEARPEGWYCPKCKAVATYASGEYKCEATGEMQKFGAYCPKLNAFPMGPGAAKCPNCGKPAGTWSDECKTYCLTTGVSYCAHCKAPFADTGEGCPMCKAAGEKKDR